MDDLDVQVVSDRIILTESSYQKANGHVVSLGQNLLTDTNATICSEHGSLHVLKFVMDSLQTRY